MLPVVLSLAGPELTEPERQFFAVSAPAGFILFNRNIRSPAQVRALTDALRACTGRSRLPILIDQEGGRVQMLRRGPAGLMGDLAALVGTNDNPAFPDFPAAAHFGRLFAQDAEAGRRAAYLNGRLIGRTLADAGITVDCAPVLDVPQAGAHDVIGDRAFAADPDAVAALGRATLDGFEAEGIVGVVKHIPGHGRATADSHRELPAVHASVAELADDLAPFRALADARWAMTAHIAYRAFDDRPATQSSRVLTDVIRGLCGFTGILVTDAIEMHALTGSYAERAGASIAAGCDLALYCSGKLSEMEAITAALQPMTVDAIARLDRSLAIEAAGDWPAMSGLAAERDQLLAI